MWLSVEEAGKTWCPAHKPGREDRCASDGCAAWRWRKAENRLTVNRWMPSPQFPPGPGATDPEVKPSMLPDDGSVVWSSAERCWMETLESFEARKRRNHQEREGYCGLAGKPFA